MPRSSVSFGEREAHRLAADQDLAVVGRVDARQRLDQRRLAGAVVAQQAMDLAGRRRRTRRPLSAIDRAEILADRLAARRSGVGHQRLRMARLRT